MPLPFKSMLKAVIMSALVPKPMVAAIGWPASMCAPSSSPEITRSSRIFHLRQPWALELAYLEFRRMGPLDQPSHGGIVPRNRPGKQHKGKTTP